MAPRVDVTRVALLLLFAAASAVWLIYVPLWLWDQHRHLLASLPWALNCLGAPFIARMGIRQRQGAVVVVDPSLLHDSFIA